MAMETEISSALWVRVTREELYAFHALRIVLYRIESGLYLHARLREVDLQRHLLAHEDVRVASLLKQRLKNVELRTGKRGSFSSLLPTARCQPITPRSTHSQHSLT